MLPTTARNALVRLEQAGFSAYAVGGCVRDLCRGVPADDIDIATSARPEEILAVFKEERCIPTGLKHGTVTVLLEQTPLEITTFRTDGTYSDNRHPDGVTFTSSVVEDLARRDFTINAMAYHPDKGILDPFDGQEDLKNGIIRCVGDPVTRFTEDALRIARMLRFLSVLDMTADSATADAATALCSRLQFVAAERKRVEWMKTMRGNGFLRVATTYPSVVCEIVPFLSPLVGFDQHSKHHTFDVYTHSMRAVQAAQGDPVVQLAALFHDIGKPATFFIDENGEGHFYSHASKSAEIAQKAMEALRFDNATIHAVLPLVLHHHDKIRADRRLIRRRLSQLGETGFRQLLMLKQADAVACKHNTHPPSFEEILLLTDDILAQQDCLTLNKLAVNGNDLLAMGIPIGPAVGNTLRALLDAVLSDKCENKREALLKLAKEISHHV